MKVLTIDDCCIDIDFNNLLHDFSPYSQIIPSIHQGEPFHRLFKPSWELLSTTGLNEAVAYRPQLWQEPVFLAVQIP